jgi:hypothetical protein
MEAQHCPEKTAELSQAQESVIASQGESVVEDLDMSKLNIICTGHSHERMKLNSHTASAHATIEAQIKTYR